MKKPSKPQILRDMPRWNPPSDARRIIEVHPEAAEQLRKFLAVDQAGTGIGYSEFIVQSVRLWQLRDAGIDGMTGLEQVSWIEEQAHDTELQTLTQAYSERPRVMAILDEFIDNCDADEQEEIRSNLIAVRSEMARKLFRHPEEA